MQIANTYLAAPLSAACLKCSLGGGAFLRIELAVSIFIEFLEDFLFLFDSQLRSCLSGADREKNEGGDEEDNVFHDG